MEASNNKQEVVIRRKQENKTSEEDEKNKSQVNKGLLKNWKMAFIKNYILQQNIILSSKSRDH